MVMQFPGAFWKWFISLNFLRDAQGALTLLWWYAICKVAQHDIIHRRDYHRCLWKQKISFVTI